MMRTAKHVNDEYRMPNGIGRGAETIRACELHGPTQIADLRYRRLPVGATTAADRRCFKKPFVIRHSSFARGFTLIEIMVVVAIMGIILAAGVPSLYGFMHKAGIRKTTSDIVETCQSARAAAIMSGSPTDLIFHPKEGTCEASGASGGYGSWAHSAKIENCSIEMLDVNLQECKDFDTVKVRFFPNGTCDEMTLVLVSGNNEWRKISLELTTALPTVSDKIQ